MAEPGEDPGGQRGEMSPRWLVHHFEVFCLVIFSPKRDKVRLKYNLEVIAEHLVRLSIYRFEPDGIDYITKFP